MAKLAIAAVVLVALLAVAQASAFRTIVTTAVEEEEQGQLGGSRQRCQQQVQQRYRQLQPCKHYLQQCSPFAMDMYMNPGQQEQQQLRQCCQQLRNFDQECVCEAVRQIVREQLQQLGPGQVQGEGECGQGSQQQQQKVQQMLQKDRNLPRECNIRRECQIQSPYY